MRAKPLAKANWPYIYKMNIFHFRCKHKKHNNKKNQQQRASYTCRLDRAYLSPSAVAVAPVYSHFGRAKLHIIMIIMKTAWAFEYTNNCAHQSPMQCVCLYDLLRFCKIIIYAINITCPWFCSRSPHWQFNWNICKIPISLMRIERKCVWPNAILYSCRNHFCCCCCCCCNKRAWFIN